MALFDSPRLPTAGSVLSRLVGLVTAARDAVLDWRDNNATHRALKSLSAHELEDIGLTRGDIEQISRTAPRF